MSAFNQINSTITNDCSHLIVQTLGLLQEKAMYWERLAEEDLNYLSRVYMGLVEYRRIEVLNVIERFKSNLIDESRLSVDHGGVQLMIQALSIGLTMQMELTALLETDEAAKIANVVPSTIVKATFDIRTEEHQPNRIPGLRFGRKTLVFQYGLLNWMNQRNRGDAE